MADIDPQITPRERTEIGVTTGPIRGSRKIHVGTPNNPQIRVAMRAIDLEPGCGEPPLNVYDPSGPYTDSNATIDINAGLPQLRREWIEARGDVESYAAWQLRPEDNGLTGPDRSAGVPRFPLTVTRPLRAKPGANVSQMHYARRGIVTPEMEYVATPREPGPRATPRPRPRRRIVWREHPRLRHPRIRPRRGRARPRDHPVEHQPPRIRTDGDWP